MEFTKVPLDTFSTIQINAGIIAKAFNPETGTLNASDIMGATTGGSTFNSNPSFVDFGADIDNVPANTKQLKRLQQYDPALSGTFITLSSDNAPRLVGAATVTGNKIVPNQKLSDADFFNTWLISDYSDVNTGTNPGFVAVHIMDALNTSGFQWSTTKDGKGQFAFDFHGHYDLEDIETVPFELYIKKGTE